MSRYAHGGSMDIKFIVALTGIAGVLASALVQYFLGRHSEANKKNIEIRAQAYIGLVNSVSEIAGSAKYEDDRKLEQLQNLNKAKTRVVLIGSDDVVKAVNKFWLEFGLLNSEKAFSAFSLIVAAMRKDLSGKNLLPLELISEALFGKQTVK